MAIVYIPALLQALTGGRGTLEVDGATVDEVIGNMDKQWPGIAARLVDGGRLRANISVAVDGEITPLGLLEAVSPGSEVHFVAAIKGGAGNLPAHNRLIGLLVLSVFINYVDRGNLSIAAPVLSSELSLSPTQLGLLFSAFFWTYSILQIGAGWMVDRFGVFWVLAGGYLIWSLATLATGFTGAFASLFAMRLLLGAGESVCYPAYSRIIASQFSEGQRGLTNALVDAGSKAGPALASCSPRSRARDR